MLDSPTSYRPTSSFSTENYPSRKSILFHTNRSISGIEYNNNFETNNLKRGISEAGRRRD
jgi:hypothetical protein